MFRTKTLYDAYHLARMQEAAKSVVNKRNMAYTPKSLQTQLALTTTPFNKSTNVVTTPQRRKLTQKDYKDKRSKNLCFYCDQKYDPRYECSGQLFSLELLAEEETNEVEDEVENQLEEESVEEQVVYPYISLNALARVNTFHTMRIEGHVGKQDIHILVDSGSTHNFVDVQCTKKLGCDIKSIYPLQVEVLGGNQILRHDASADSIDEANPGKSTPKDSISQQDGLETIQPKAGTEKEANNTEKEANIDQYEFNTSLDLSSSDDATKEIKLEDLSKLVKDVDVDFMDLDSLDDDEPIIVQDKEEEEEVHAEQHTKTKDMFVSQPPSPRSIQIQELTNQLLVQSLKLELSKLLTSYDFNNSLPTVLKELPSKLNDIYGEFKELKRYVKTLEIELPWDLKEIPTKLEEFQSTVSSLTKQVDELHKLKLEVPAGLLALPGQVSSITAQLSKLKTLDALPSLLNRVTNELRVSSFFTTDP
ncbi:hypothetical protein Tco_1438037 [Tanacetum coccineum]